MRVGETAAHLHDHAPGANFLEIHGPPRFAGWSTATILLRMAARLVVLVAVAMLCRRTCVALRHWAVFGEELGIVRYRRRRSAAEAVTRHPARSVAVAKRRVMKIGLDGY